MKILFSFKEQTFIVHSIDIEVQTVEAILFDSKRSVINRLQFEHELDVLKRVQKQISSNLDVTLTQEEQNYVQFTIGLRLVSLSEVLLTDELCRPESFNLVEEEMKALLNAYRKLI